MYKGYKELNKQDIANYQRLSNQLTKKYGSQNIKQTSLKTTKSGASYVKGKFFTYANDTSYQAIATPTTTTDSAGRKHYGYRSTKLYTYVY